MLQSKLKSHASLFAEVLTPHQKHLVASFAQSPEDYFDNQPNFQQAKAPASGEIFGIVRAMVW